MSSLLLDEPCVLVQPSLVRRLGLVDAAMLQQLHYWMPRATCIHDGDAYVYKTYQDWSEEIGVSAKVARGALDRLRKGGVVVAIRNPGDARDNTLWWRIDYALIEPGRPSAPQGSPPAPTVSQSAPQGRSAGAPQCPAETTSETTTENPPARRPMSYAGKPVTAETVDVADRLLGTFNDATLSRLQSFKPDGAASSHLRQIVGALLDREGEASEAEWHRAIRNTVAAPPSWVEGPVTLGAVFGAKAADHALANDGTSRTDNSRDAAWTATDALNFPVTS